MCTKSLLIAILLLCSNMLRAQDVTPDTTGMSIDAHTFGKKVEMGWNLGNSFESEGSETAWGNPKTTKAMITALKNQGFNSIRIPVRWYCHLTNSTEMTIQSSWISRVKEVVDWCLDAGMTVIINTHHEGWLENNCTYDKQTENNTKLRKLWTNIATYFRDYDGRLVFSATNENVMKNSNGDWLAGTEENYAVQNSYNQTFVDAVRQTGGRNYYRNLIVQVYKCDPSDGLAYFIIPEDKVEGRLSVEFHYYSPYSYCSGNANGYYYWGSKYKNMGKNVTPDGNERTMANLFRTIRKTWYEKGLGVVVGEYGVSHHISSSSEQALQEENEGYYLQCLVSEARKNGFPAYVWDNNAFGSGSEKFGIFDRNNNMNLKYSFLVDGIREGSKTIFSELADDEETEKDWGEGGKLLWSGNKALNWGNGLQLAVSASQFANCSDQAMIVIYYTQDATASYDDIQIVGSDWKGISFSVEDDSYTGDFSPRNYYGTSGETHITPFVLTGSVLAAAKKNGIHIQGYGVTATKIVLVDDINNGIDVLSMGGNANPTAIYTLSGQRVTDMSRKGIYIVGGKKIQHTDKHYNVLP